MGEGKKRGFFRSLNKFTKPTLTTYLPSHIRLKKKTPRQYSYCFFEIYQNVSNIIVYTLHSSIHYTVAIYLDMEFCAIRFFYSVASQIFPSSIPSVMIMDVYQLSQFHPCSFRVPPHQYVQTVTA